MTLLPNIVSFCNRFRWQKLGPGIAHQFFSSLPIFFSETYVDPPQTRASENSRCTDTVYQVYNMRHLLAGLIILLSCFLPWFYHAARVPSPCHVLWCCDPHLSRRTSGNGALTFSKPDEVQFMDNIVTRTSANPVRFSTSMLVRTTRRGLSRTQHQCTDNTYMLYSTYNIYMDYIYI